MIIGSLPPSSNFPDRCLLASRINHMSRYSVRSSLLFITQLYSGLGASSKTRVIPSGLCSWFVMSSFQVYSIYPGSSTNPIVRSGEPVLVSLR